VFENITLPTGLKEQEANFAVLRAMRVGWLFKGWHSIVNLIQQRYNKKMDLPNILQNIFIKKEHWR